jgi:hypothetical protein
MATVPNPQTWALNDVPTAADFNTDIRDATNFCNGPQRVLVRHSSNPDLLENVWTRLQWDTTVTETEAGMHDDSTNNSRLIAVTAGYYQVWLSSRWEVLLFIPDGFMQGGRSIAVEKNAGGTAGNGDEVCSDRRAASEFALLGDTGSSMASCTGFVHLNAGEYVEAFALNGDNSNCEFWNIPDSNNVRSCFFGMVWIAP